MPSFLEAVGGSATVALIEALEARGRLVSDGILDYGEMTLKASQVLFRTMIWQGFGIDAWLDHASTAQLELALRELWHLLDAASELLPVSGSFSLARFDEAIRMVEAGAQRGKVLLLG